MLTLRRAGLSVPGDISVVGFDGHEMASVVDLTTVSQPVHEQGELAARMLVDGLRDRHLEPVDVVLPTRLVIRGSTAPPPLAGRRARGDGAPTAVAGSRTMRS
jgi:LacI family transcriptional regulator, repressor for deo operon, udp, cdd, tsx, nupC, and nupG